MITKDGIALFLANGELPFDEVGFCITEDWVTRISLRNKGVAVSVKEIKNTRLGDECHVVVSGLINVSVEEE